MQLSPEIAIVDAETLACMGLRGLIERMMPEATVRTFNSFEQLVRDSPDMYFHYFVSAQILLEHSTFFVERREKTIVLVNGSAGKPQTAHFHTLNIYQSEDGMVRSLLQLQQSAHAHGQHLPADLKTPMEKSAQPEDPNGLSVREVEVLILIVSGLTNKEIAHRLYISVTTVISHRKNIMEKLNVRSVSGLTIYAVMNGYIEADRI
ncbi:MAG: response regulator transcription factor [Paraprevotella sp.]|nr:response regulator transcription factor [Paraprevotella sp.]